MSLASSGIDGNRYLLLAVISIFVLAFWTNPSTESFFRFCKLEIERQHGPLSAFFSNWSLWFSSKTGNLFYQNYYFFSLIEMPELLANNVIPSFSGKECTFLGIFSSWYPICMTFALPSCPMLMNCNGNGVCLANERCLCLPSWRGEDCSVPIEGFIPLTDFPILDKISWIEGFVLLNIMLYFLWQIPRFEHYMRTHFTTSWANTFIYQRFWTLVTASFTHKHIVLLFNNMYGFFVYGPILYQVIGPHMLLFGVFFNAIFSNLISLYYRRIRGLVDLREYGGSGLIIAIKVLYMLSTSTWSDSIFRTSLQIIFSHACLDYIFLGNKLDIASYFGGLIAGFIGFKYLL